VTGALLARGEDAEVFAIDEMATSATKRRSG